MESRSDREEDLAGLGERLGPREPRRRSDGMRHVGVRALGCRWKQVRDEDPWDEARWPEDAGERK
jgi:hypothetical protein